MKNEIKMIVPKNFGDFLKQEFQKRKNKNPRYSMRSFAAKIGIDQSLVSKVILGKRNLSQFTMSDCLSKLDIPQEQIDLYLQKFNKKAMFHRPIKEDVFNVISQWYHFAIIELFKLKNFKHDLSFIAKALKIDRKSAEAALERLERFGFIESKSGSYHLSKPNNTWTSHSATSDARKAYQKKLLEKSIHALENVPLEKRHHSSYTFAVSEDKIEELKEKIFDLTLKLGTVANKDENFNQVYQFTISLFPLTDFKDSE